MDIKLALAAARSEDGWIDDRPRGRVTGGLVIEYYDLPSSDKPLTVHRAVGEECCENRDGDISLAVRSLSGPHTTLIERGLIRRWKPIRVLL